jgi:hypothetical protein
MLCEAVKNKLVVFGDGKLFFRCFCGFGGLGYAFWLVLVASLCSAGAPLPYIHFEYSLKRVSNLTMFVILVYIRNMAEYWSVFGFPKCFMPVKKKRTAEAARLDTSILPRKAFVLSVIIQMSLEQLGEVDKRQSAKYTPPECLSTAINSPKLFFGSV